jgi:tetratricopeptide (TPR) repeat protein
MDSSKRDLERKFDSADVLISEGRLEEATSILEDLIEKHTGPGITEPFAVLCNLYTILGKTAIPEEWIRKALDLDPALSKNLINLSSRLYEENRLKECESILSVMVSCDPGHFEAWNDLGAVHLTQGEFLSAERNFRKALDLKPGYPEGVVNLVALFMATNRIVQAVDTAMDFQKETHEASPDVFEKLAGFIEPAAPEKAVLLMRRCQREQRESHPESAEIMEV